MSRLRARSLVGVCMRSNQSMFLSPSLPLALKSISMSLGEDFFKKMALEFMVLISLLGTIQLDGPMAKGKISR